jgi:hypothetical protein
VLELGFLVLFALLIGLFMVLGRRKTARPAGLRRIEAFDRLPATVGEAVESGRRLHLSLGNGVIGQADTATTLAGLTAATQTAAAAVVSDKPPIITSADGSAMLLAQDALKAVYRQQNAEERFDAGAARVIGLSPVSFSAALAPLVKDEAVAGNVLIGAVGPEAALLAEAGRRAGAPTLAGSDNLAAQAAFLAVAEDTLLGGDLFAAGAYLEKVPAHVASLRAQDVLRVILILAILAGVTAKTLGLLQ